MIKQVILIRRDLHMRRGKEIAQGSHASQAWLSNRILNTIKRGDCTLIHSLMEIPVLIDSDEEWWLQHGTKKVTLQVSSEEELLSYYNKAKEAGLTVNIIKDEGITEFNGVHTFTAVAIGPNKSDLIDKITGDLKIY